MKQPNIVFPAPEGSNSPYRVRTGRSLNLRMEVIAAYGGRCRCCGDPNWQFLTVDHIYGDGAIERKAGLYSNFYQWLKDRGFPKDRYQLLCMNCNIAKHRYGVCPHQVAEALIPYWGTDINVWDCLCACCRARLFREQGERLDRHLREVRRFYRRRRRSDLYPGNGEMLRDLHLKQRGLTADALNRYTEENLRRMKELGQPRKP